MVIIKRGPILSVNLPQTIPEKPWAIVETAKAPEVRALLQPRSLIIGSKKTPKELKTPNTSIESR